jgi:hypothetical protein
VGGTLYENPADEQRTIAFISLNALDKQFETKSFKRLPGLSGGLTKMVFLERSVAADTCVGCDLNKNLVVLAQQTAAISLLHKISVHSDGITDLVVHGNQVFVSSRDKTIIKVTLNLQKLLN